MSLRIRREIIFNLVAMFVALNVIGCGIPSTVQEKASIAHAEQAYRIVVIQQHSKENLEWIASHAVAMMVKFRTALRDLQLESIPNTQRSDGTMEHDEIVRGYKQDIEAIHLFKGDIHKISDWLWHHFNLILKSNEIMGEMINGPDRPVDSMSEIIKRAQEEEPEIQIFPGDIFLPRQSEIDARARAMFKPAHERISVDEFVKRYKDRL